ncbi:MAG TPA: indolepyruvate ferredoxin oxidoreductase family protein [Gammaproteobacteria bacterium]
MPLRRIEDLDERYDPEAGVALITGLQAIVRLLLGQRYRDRRENLDTAGFVSGYRGSPLGGLDRELWRAKRFLDAAQIRFQPGLNEDLAATSIWGSQQANLFPGARHQGVFGLWYGKGPGVDRSGDALKHGNAAGSSAHGGVLVVAGDDHTCKSSSLPHQSELAFVDAMIPVLSPADVEEIVELGLLGYALSRFSGCWVGLKLTQETADATEVVRLDPPLSIVRPDFEIPPGGLNIRWPDPPTEQERRLERYKLPAARAFARANRLDRIILDAPHARLGIVTAGKAHLDTLQALEDLGIDRARAADLGIRLLKIGMTWPLEPEAVLEFADGLEQILVVEEKRALVETQIKEHLYHRPAASRPLVIGKHDERGAPLLPSSGDLRPALIARVLVERLRRFGPVPLLEEHIRAHDEHVRSAEALASEARLPHFCSGCPHNTSTVVPDGSRAIGGIGCHYMAAWMDRSTATFTQMGGEGATWIGQAPFTDTRHVFQNLGDGTYAHSGSLAIRAAVAAGVNITYKILFNDAVAMTGGQPIEGRPTVASIAAQLAAEGVDPIVVVTDDPAKHAGRADLPAGVRVQPRSRLDRVQLELRECRGVSALIYDQPCAAELHRKRKRAQVPTPTRRVAINELVCEGCGDCNTLSNCLSVVPLDTEFGRKRRINQSSCNQDFSCLRGFCPSFVILDGAHRNPPVPLAAEAVPSLPEPAAAEIADSYNILLAGVGGMGIVTASGLIGLAAHLEGKAVRQLDQTGLAQRFGAVLSHVRIAGSRERLHTPRIPRGRVDLLLGADLVVSGGEEALASLSTERSAVIVNTHHEMPPEFVRDPDFRVDDQRLLHALGQRCRPGDLATLDATRLAVALLGDSVAANVFLLGFAFQRGKLPVSGAALYRALELFGVNVAQNKLAFDWGRFTAHDPAAVETLAAGGRRKPVPASRSLHEAIERREAFLEQYQDRAYAARYRDRIERIRRSEQRVRPGGSALTAAVARNYFKLLAYKDEYEVARLHTETGFLESLRQHFGGDFKLRFQLSPPLIARIDPDSGRPRKYEVGEWVLGPMRLLARLRRVRGTKLDVFGYSKERRMERRLIADYERFLDRVEAELDDERFDLAVALAKLPDGVRGFGPVKERAVERYERERRELLERWSTAPGADEGIGSVFPMSA